MLGQVNTTPAADLPFFTGNTTGGIPNPYPSGYPIRDSNGMIIGWTGWSAADNARVYGAPGIALANQFLGEPAQVPFIGGAPSTPLPTGTPWAVPLSSPTVIPPAPKLNLWQSQPDAPLPAPSTPVAASVPVYTPTASQPTPTVVVSPTTTNSGIPITSSSDLLTTLEQPTSILGLNPLELIGIAIFGVIIIKAISSGGGRR